MCAGCLGVKNFFRLLAFFSLLTFVLVCVSAMADQGNGTKLDQRSWKPLHPVFAVKNRKQMPVLLKNVHIKQG